MWLVELTKALAWPCTVIFIALLFKSEIRSLPTLLSRVKEFELPGGIKAKMDFVEQLQATSENPVAEKLDVKFSLPSPSPVLSMIETRLQSEAELIEESKRQAVLLRALAQTRLYFSHEFTYNRIFGSQISILKRLNELGKITIEDARTFFTPYAKQFSNFYETYGFDGWLGFMLNGGLVTQHDNILELTEYGRDFLIYITTNRLSELKLL